MLIRTSFQKRGTWTSRTPTARMARGELKKKLSMRPPSAPTCHIAKNATTPATPRTVRSLRR
jgi:hypothetical protein